LKAETLFYIIIAILVVNFIFDQVLDYVNAKRFSDPIPSKLRDVYDDEEYKKSQAYKRERYKFGVAFSSVMFVATILFFFLDGFAFADRLARAYSDKEIVMALVFFGMIMLGSSILSMPFEYYSTFVIEEKYGFNKSTKATFFMDKLKGLTVGAVMGGLLLSAIIWFYQSTGQYFWLYAWGAVTVFTVFMNLFYSRLIVPIFNKQTPLEEGSLRTQIENYSATVGFSLDKIFVIDGSKRSTKANAYFSGFGREKRVTLFDTLINDLDENEVVAVLAHEVGHYKRKHIIFNLAAAILSTGFTFWLLSLFIDAPLLSNALNVSEPSFHVGVVAFGVLYAPISVVTGLIMNSISRKFEYQADDYAKNTYEKQPMISALKKLSKNSLSNLTPHPLYVAVHYSHPTLLQRVENLED